jgi:hypothetical protein
MSTSSDKNVNVNGDQLTCSTTSSIMIIHRCIKYRNRCTYQEARSKSKTIEIMTHKNTQKHVLDARLMVNTPRLDG